MKNDLPTNPENATHNHAGHRERVRETILKHGFQHLHDHELLEFLLFYALPRRDTNQLAHELIEHFGSFHALLEADVAKIAERPGIGVSAALFLKGITESIVRYTAGAEEPVLRYTRYEQIARYLCNYFNTMTKERTIALLFDNKMKLLSEVDMGEGTTNASPVDLYRLTNAVMEKHAAGVVLAHNHPGGIAKPSPEDNLTTRRIYDFLAQLSIPLLEHVVVCGRETYPIIHFSGLYDVDRVVSASYGANFMYQFFDSGEKPFKIPNDLFKK